MAKTDEIKKATEAKAPNETITMTRSQLEGIVAEMIAKSGSPKKPQRVTDHVATLRFHEGRPVVQYGQVREVKENGEKVAYMNINVQEDGEFVAEPIKVRYIDFLNDSNFSKVQILKQHAEKKEISHGEFHTQNANEVYDKKFQSELAEDLEVRYIYTCDVEVLEGDLKGKKFTVPATALNA